MTSSPSSEAATAATEGGLEAPTRHPIDWNNPRFYDQAELFDELERVFDLCDAVGKLAGIPIVVNAVNAANQFKPARAALKRVLGVHPQAGVPKYHKHGDTLRGKQRARVAGRGAGAVAAVPVAQPAGRTRGKVALFATCYGNYNEPGLGEDLIAVLEHNNITVSLAPTEQCCGMPKMELGDLRAVEKSMRANIPELASMVAKGCDIIAPVPSCALMLRQEWPLLFPDDAEVQRVAAAVFDPFEYLMAGRFIEHGMADGSATAHPVSLLRRAYSI